MNVSRDVFIVKPRNLKDAIDRIDSCAASNGPMMARA